VSKALAPSSGLSFESTVLGTCFTQAIGHALDSLDWSFGHSRKKEQRRSEFLMNRFAWRNEVKWRESSAPARATVEQGLGISKRELEVAYREHSAFVWRNARRFGCDTATAEDVVHEVFLIVAAKFENFRREASLRTWLFAITYRTVQRLARDHSRRGARLQRYFELY
jgi:hypothetical protein